jgi:hypothetical protein
MRAIVDASARPEPEPEIEEPRAWLDPAEVQRVGRFFASARAWHALGANVIPEDPGTKHPALGGWGRAPSQKTGAWILRDLGLEPGAMHVQGAAQVPLDTVREWAARYRDHGCLVMPASIPGGATVIDVDDLRVLPQVLDACGDTPYRTHSGRAGGGVHLWYFGPAVRSKNGIVPGVDVKSSGGIVVAPGTKHATTALEYTPSDALAEVLRSGRIPSGPALPSDYRARLERATAGLRRPTRLDLSTLADTLSERTKERATAKILRKIARGEPMADAGERDGVLFRVCATLAEHWPHAEHDAIAALLRPSLDAWGRDDAAQGRPDEDWHAIAAEKWERCAGASQEALGEVDEILARRRSMLWSLVGQERCTDAADPAAGPIVVHRSGTYYVRLGTDWHGPLTRDDCAAADMLAGLRAIYGIDAPDFAALLGGHGAPAREIRHSYTVQQTEFRRGVLHVLAAERRGAIEPRYSETVARGIESLAGQHAPALRHWLAGFTRLDRPCKALILSGPRGAGKSLLMAGLARIWLHGAAKMSHVVGRRFNDAISETPFALADDDADNAAESGKALAGYLRAAVSDREHKFERKHHSVQRLDGSLRFAICSNDAGKLIQGAVSYELNDESIHAFSERLLHIPVQEAARGWWRHGLRADTGETEAERTERLVQGDEIAAHVLWLAEQGAEPFGRFWCASGAGDHSLYAQLRLSTGLRGDILLRLAEGAAGATIGGATRVGRVWHVQAREFVQGWTVGAPRGWGPRTGGSALVALADASEVAQPGGGVHAISHALVQWYAKQCGLS